MEVTSTNKEEDEAKLNVDIDEIVAKDNPPDNLEIKEEKAQVEEDLQPQVTTNIDYDDDEDSGDDFAVITKNATGVDSSPAKNMFSIKTISNVQAQNNYKISKTAIDLDHPGNVNGVPTIDYDLSKLTDECKPWKKPGADVSDFFNYGFTEDTWLLYCEKQKSLRLTHDNSTLKTLSGLTNFGYNLSGSHIHMGFNRNNQKTTKGGIIDVIGCQQNGELRNKHNDMGGMGNKISTIPVQTGHMNMNQNQAGNYMSGLASQAINSNLLNPLMNAIAMGMLPNNSNIQSVMNNQPNMPIDAKMGQFDGGPRNFPHNNNWATNPDFDRHNSVDSMHSHEDYGDKKSYLKSDRGTRRNEREDSRHYRSRDKREKSPEKRRRTRSRSRDRGHDSKYSRSKRNRSPEDRSRHKKYSRDRSRDRGSSEGSSKKHRRHRSTKKHRTKSRSHDSRKDRRHRHKSPATGTTEESSKHRHGKEDIDAVDKSDRGQGPDTINIKKEMETSAHGN